MINYSTISDTIVAHYDWLQDSPILQWTLFGFNNEPLVRNRKAHMIRTGLRVEYNLQQKN